MSDAIMPAEPPAEPNHERNHGLLSLPTKVNLMILCVILLIFSGLMLTAYLTNIITMLAASLILTYILLSPVGRIDTWLQKIRIGRRSLPPTLSRALSILVVYLLFFGMLAVSLIRIAPALSVQIKEFAHDLPGYVSHMAEAAPATAGQPVSGQSVSSQAIRQTSTETISGPTANTTVSTQTDVAVTAKKPQPAKLFATSYALAIQKLVANYKQYVSKLGSFILDLGATTLNGLIYTLTTLVLVFYLLHDGKAVKDGLVDLVPTRNEAALDAFLNRLHTEFHGIIKGQLLMSFLAGGLIYLILMTMGVKYALLLGIIFGIVSILPVIGPWLGLIPIIGIMAFSSHPIHILQILLVTGLFYITKAYWIWPRLLRRSDNIHPILFVLTFVACMKLVGFLGLLLSFPLASILNVAIQSLQESHQQHPIQTRLSLL